MSTPESSRSRAPHVYQSPPHPKRKGSKRIGYSTRPQRLFSLPENAVHTSFFTKLCTHIHRMGNCNYLTQGGYGKITQCQIECGDDMKVINIVEKKVKLKDSSRELAFMLNYCSDGNNLEFSQLLWYYILGDELVLGMPQYTCSLEDVYSNNNNDKYKYITTRL